MIMSFMSIFSVKYFVVITRLRKKCVQLCEETFMSKGHIRDFVVITQYPSKKEIRETLHGENSSLVQRVSKIFQSKLSECKIQQWYPYK